MSLAQALKGGDVRDLLERAGPAMGLPGVRPRMEVAREIAGVLVRGGSKGRALIQLFVRSEEEGARLLGAAALAEMAVAGQGRDEAFAALSELAGDERAVVRAGVTDSLRTLLTADLTATLIDLRSWMDGFLQAHVALAALADRQILTRIVRVDALREMLDAAFVLADGAPRAADRWQGVRTLRNGFPSQITAFVGRFGELYDWLLERMGAERPETREVLEETIRALDKASWKRSEVDALRAALAKSAKAPRDPSRIVAGTRKRGKR